MKRLCDFATFALIVAATLVGATLAALVFWLIVIQMCFLAV